MGARATVVGFEEFHAALAPFGTHRRLRPTRTGPSPGNVLSSMPPASPGIPDTGGIRSSFFIE